MKNFNLIAFVLSGIASLIGMGSGSPTIDENGIKSDTAAVAAYVGLDATPAKPVPFPAIQIVPAGDVGESGPAEPAQEPAERLPAIQAVSANLPAPPPDATPTKFKECLDGSCRRPAVEQGEQAYANRGRIRRFLFRRCG